MSGIKIVCPNANFDGHQIKISEANGVANTTTKIWYSGGPNPSDNDRYTISLDGNGYAEIENTIIPQTGVFGYEAFAAINNNITKLSPLYWDLKDVTILKYIFAPFRSLIELDLKHLQNTGNITSMEGAFNKLPISEIDLSYLDLHSVTNINNICGDIDNAAGVNTALTKFSFGNSPMTISTCFGSFAYCRNLYEIDAHNADFTQASDYTYIFYAVSFETKAGIIRCKNQANANWFMARLAEFPGVASSRMSYNDSTKILTITAP